MSQPVQDVDQRGQQWVGTQRPQFVRVVHPELHGVVQVPDVLWLGERPLHRVIHVRRDAKHGIRLIQLDANGRLIVIALAEKAGGIDEQNRSRIGNQETRRPQRRWNVRGVAVSQDHFIQCCASHPVGNQELACSFLLAG